MLDAMPSRPPKTDRPPDDKQCPSGVGYAPATVPLPGESRCKTWACALEECFRRLNLEADAVGGIGRVKAAWHTGLWMGKASGGTVPGGLMSHQMDAAQGQLGFAVGAGAMPTVSVVVPCYNYGRFLADAVRSVVSQQGVDARVLVIDDCSLDDSAEVGHRLAREYPQVEFLRHEVNVGHIATYNEGLLEWADGDYLVLLSADDLLAPGSLARAVSVMEAHASVGMVHGGFQAFAEGALRADPPARAPSVTITEGGEWLRKRCAEAVCVVTTPTVVVRRSVHQRVGGYKAALPHAADMELWLRIAAVSDIAFLGGVTQAHYRLHDTSMSAGVYRDPLADVRERTAVYSTFFAEHASLLDTWGIDPARTFARLASESLWSACRAYEKGQVDHTLVAERIAFAQAVYPHSDQLRAYRALRRRQRLGATNCLMTQIFFGTTAVRKARNLLWWRRLERTGG